MLYYQDHIQYDGRQGVVVFYLTRTVKHIIAWFTDRDDLRIKYPDAIRFSS